MKPTVKIQKYKLGKVNKNGPYSKTKIEATTTINGDEIYIELTKSQNTDFDGTEIAETIIDNAKDVTTNETIKLRRKEINDICSYFNSL